MPTCNVLGETQEHKKAPLRGKSGAPAHATSDPDNVAVAMERRVENPEYTITLVTFGRAEVASDPPPLS